MIRDCRANEEVMKSFHSSKYGNNVPVDALAVNASTWPIVSANHPSVTLPSNVTQWLNSFDKFYTGKYHDRKVEHFHHLSRAEVRYNITDSRSVMLTLSAYQVSMLSLFTRSCTTIQLGEMVKRCSVPKNIICRQLKPLIIYGLLNTSDYSLVNDDTKLSLNPDFTLPEGVEQQSMLIDPKDDSRLLNMSKKPSSSAATPDGSSLSSSSGSNPGLLSDEVIEEMVEKERQHVLQAAVMRVMKQSKKMTINALQEKVTETLATRFQVTQPMLKTTIATLKQLNFVDFSSSSGQVEYIP